MSKRLGSILGKCESLAARLESGLGRWNEPGTPAALAAEILGLSLSLPDVQRRDLAAPAKLLCDNLSREVAVYSFLGAMVRGLESCAARNSQAELSASVQAFKIRVMGN